MEILVRNPEIPSWQIIFIIDLAIFFIICLVGYLIYKKYTKENDNNRIIAIIISAIWILFISTTMVEIVGDGTLLSLDIATQNISVDNDYISYTDEEKSAIFIYTNDKEEYHFPGYDVIGGFSDKEITELIEEKYIGHLCEIEYYKWSKRVKRITIVE